MSLTFRDFVRLGASQRHTQSNPAAAAFFSAIGPLGTHARIRNGRVINTLAGIDLNEKRVLDIGSGHGYTLFWLAHRFPRARLEGLEADPTLVEEGNRAAQAEHRNNLCFRRGTFQDLLPEACYDLVISIDVLEHVPDDVGMLKRMCEVTKPGGFIVIHVPLRHQLQQRIFPVFRQHRVEDHVRDEYLPNEIRDKVEQAGFRVARVEYGFGLWGELSFELNNLFWRSRPLRNLLALATLPVTLATGYLDIKQHMVVGNSIVLVAQRTE